LREAILLRWLAGSVLRGTLLMMLAFGGLLLFFDFLDALDRLGKPGWDLTRVVGYALLLQPGRWYEVAPVALLVGTLLALAQMARYSELAVLRASGLSPFGLWRRIAVAAILFAAATMALGEWGVPKSERIARQWEDGIGLFADRTASSKARGLWVRDGDLFVQIGAVRDDQTIAEVWWYRLRGITEPELAAIDYGEIGHYDAEKGGWRFPSVSRRAFSDREVRAERLSDTFWRSDLTPETLALLWVEPQRMSLAVLGRYIRFLKQNGGESRPFEAAFWRKLFLPLTMVVMATLAIPFVLTHSRTAVLGVKLFAGTMLGVVFFLLTQLADRIVAIWGVSPVFAALLPAISFTALAMLLWWQVERR